jgi:hypothetical protein
MDELLLDRTPINRGVGTKATAKAAGVGIGAKLRVKAELDRQPMQSEFDAAQRKVANVFLVVRLDVVQIVIGIFDCR